MEYLLFITGVLLGALVSMVIYCRNDAIGVLLIDNSDPEKDVYRFDVGNIDDLSKRKRVILKIKNDADLSQK